MRVALLSLLLLSFGASAEASEAGSCKPFALTVHLAAQDEEAASAKVQAWLAIANRHFREAGVCFFISEQRSLAPERQVLETIRERRGLRKQLRPRTVNAFFVERILDPHPSEATRRAARWQGFEPTSGALAGAHIEAPGHTPNTYLLISLDSNDLTLTHELGHFMGASHHRDPHNIMSYGSKRERFAEEQYRAFQRKARRLRRRRAVLLGSAPTGGATPTR